LTPAPNTIVRFEERRADAPEAIKEWFYPGDEYGEEFVYPKSRATELAKATNQNVASIPNQVAQNITKPAKTAHAPPVAALKNAPVQAVNPKGTVVEIAQAATPKPPEPAAKPAPTQTATPPAPNPATSSQLPKTASNEPLVLLIGVVLLGLSRSLRSLVKRVG
jgi:cell division septation protein DedD